MKTVIGVLLFVLLAVNLRAEKARVAVLGEGAAAALSDLVMVELGRKEGIELVERAEIQRILKEQEMNAAFSQDTLAGRVRLGQILKADLLVILRIEKEGEQNLLNVAVSETKHGLRICSTHTDRLDLKEMVPFVVDVCDRSVTKHRDRNMTIFAVPPFASRDLTHDYDYLQEGMAKLCEEYLMLSPTVVVVEIDEAYEIGKELLLPGGNEKASRDLPFYITGDFQNIGRGDNRRIALNLSLECGQRTLYRETSKELTSAAVPGFLRLFIKQCFRAVSGELPNDLEPSLEADRLVEQAELFRRFGHLREALDLYEAALLLESSQTSWHWASATLAADLTRSLYDPYCDKAMYRQKALNAAGVYRRGVSHLKTFLETQEMNASKFAELAPFWSATEYFLRYSESSDDLKDLFKTIENEKHQMLITIIRDRHQNGTLSDETVSCVIDYLTPGKNAVRFVKYDDRWQVIQLIKHLPKASSWIERLVTINIAPSEYKDPDYERFLNMVYELPDGIGEQSVTSMRKRIEAYFASRYLPVQPTKNTVSNIERSSKITLNEIELKVVRNDGQGPVEPGRINGWLNCAQSGDILWENKKLYLMKNNGVLKEIYASDERLFNFVNPSYDGKYAWFPVTHKHDPLMVAVDPDSGKVREFTAQDGILPMTHSVVTAPIGPGKILVAASFGRDPSGKADRSWCAFVSIQSSDDLAVDVFYEAPSHVDAEAMLLLPQFCFAFAQPGNQTPEKAILKYNSFHYAVIDLSCRKLEFPEANIASHLDGDRIAQNGCNIYWAARNSALEEKPAIWTIGLPDLTKTGRIQDAPEEGIIAFDGQRVHLLSAKRWWIADRIDTAFKEVAVSLPNCKYNNSKLFKTSNYGLVYMTTEGRSYTVRLSE